MLWPLVSGASRLPLVNSGVAAMAMSACLLSLKNLVSPNLYAQVPTSLVVGAGLLQGRDFHLRYIF